MEHPVKSFKMIEDIARLSIQSLVKDQTTKPAPVHAAPISSHVPMKAQPAHSLSRPTGPTLPPSLVQALLKQPYHSSGRVIRDTSIFESHRSSETLSASSVEPKRSNHFFKSSSSPLLPRAVLRQKPQNT